MEQNLGQTVYDYDAFISYRHTPRDMDLAQKLHSALENYRTPRYLVQKGLPPKLKKIFRDREELPTSSDLGQDIENALRRSRFLIVICSPEAAQSQWVLKEVETFASLHGYERILTLLVAGEPDTAFPPGLIRHQLDEAGAVMKVIEPLAADVRPQGKATAAQLLKVEKLRILAALLGCRFDELRQRENERRMRRVVVTSTAAAAFLLAITAFTLWQLGQVSAAKAVAEHNEQLALQAQKQAQASEQQALQEQSNQLSLLARQTMDKGDQLLGLAMAMDALPKDLQKPERPLTEQAQSALYYTASARGPRQLMALYPDDSSHHQMDSNHTFARWLTDGNILTCNGYSLWMYDGSSGQMQTSWNAPEGAEILAANAQGDRVLAAAYQQVNDGPDDSVTLWLYDPKANRVIHQYDCDTGLSSVARDYFNVYRLDSSVHAEFSPDGRHFYIAGIYYRSEEAADSTLTVYDAQSGDAVAQMPAMQQKFEHAQFLDDTAVLYHSVDHAIAYDFATKSTLYSAQHTLPGVDRVPTRTAALSADHSHLVLCDGYFAYRIDLATGVETKTSVSTSFSLNADGSLAASWIGDSFSIYDLATGLPVSLGTISRPGDARATFLFSPDNRFVLFSTGTVLDTRNLCYNARTATPLYSDDAQAHFAISLDSTRMLYLNDNGIATVYALRDEAGSTEIAAQNVGSATIAGGGALLSSGKNLGQSDMTLSYAGLTGDKPIPLDQDVDAVWSGQGQPYAGYLTGKTLKFIDMQNGQQRAQLVIEGNLDDVEYSSDGRLAVVCSDDSLQVFEIATGKILLQGSDLQGWDADDDWYQSAGYFPDGTIWVTGAFGPFYGLKVFDSTGKQLAQTEIPTRDVWSGSSAWRNGDATRMLTNNENGNILWRADSSHKMDKISDIAGYLMCCGDKYFVMRSSNMLYAYDWDGNVLSSYSIGDNFISSRIQEKAGTLLITDQSDVTLWNIHDGTLLARLYSSEYQNLLDAALTQDGTRLVIVGQAGSDAYVRTYPFLADFEQAYTSAKEMLHGRTYDAVKDLAHVR